MIASLTGDVIAQTDDSLVIQVGGVGLLVHVPASLQAQARVGSHVQVYTQLVVRQDALTLYGFEREDERSFFNLLLGVDGVGPRIALAILSTLSVDTIRRAVLGEQADIFSRVPGVGKRTAQKILLHLQGRVGAGIPGLSSTAGLLDTDTEVMDALTALGYSIVEAQTALQSIPRDAPKDVETRLRIALQYFSS
ncbi:MAG TPA: Holliday junction branch migration protein RuvA [Anaerolineaceae bacterium]